MSICAAPCTCTVENERDWTLGMRCPRHGESGSEFAMLRDEVERRRESVQLDRAKAWAEGWECARLTPDGDLRPVGEVREALSLAGFADDVIESALAELHPA